MSLGVGGCVWDGGGAEHAHRRAHDERAAAPNVLGRDQSGDLGRCISTSAQPGMGAVQSRIFAGVRTSIRTRSYSYCGMALVLCNFSS